MAATVTHLPVSTPDATPEQTAPYFRADPSPLARFLSLEAGWTTADLCLFGGDPMFRAEVAGVMAVLEASGPG